MRGLLLCVLLSGSAAFAVAQSSGLRRDPADRATTIGMEGRVQVVLPGSILSGKPVDDRAPLVVRIASATSGTGVSPVSYEIAYIGSRAGTFDLRDYLLREDGGSTNDLPSIPVTIRSVLPANHSGELDVPPDLSVPRLGGYRTLAAAVAALWFAPLVIFAVRRARRKKNSVLAPPLRPLTLEEQLRPLVEEAIREGGRLPASGLARMEFLVLAHWRERLALRQCSQHELFEILRRHPEASALLTEMELWLHARSRPDRAKVDVGALLAPYRLPPHPTLSAHGSGKQEGAA